MDLIRLNKKNGFTLIELVIVIVIISIISLIAYPKYLDLRDDARKVVDRELSDNLRTGVHIFFAKNKRFPINTSELLGCLDGLPAGWVVKKVKNEGSSNFYIFLESPGLPSQEDKKAVIRYMARDGSVVFADHDTVFITATGSKYHRMWCQYVDPINHPTAHPVSLDWAKDHGYGACSVCEPPQ